jgi:hypothetical protein
VSYNPWGKKNPLLSFWLSGANAVFGATRSQMTAALHRQMNEAITDSTKQVLAFWGMNTPARKRPAKRRR